MANAMVVYADRMSEAWLDERRAASQVPREFMRLEFPGQDVPAAYQPRPRRTRTSRPRRWMAAARAVAQKAAAIFL